MRPSPQCNVAEIKVCFSFTRCTWPTDWAPEQCCSLRVPVSSVGEDSGKHRALTWERSPGKRNLFVLLLFPLSSMCKDEIFLKSHGRDLCMLRIRSLSSRKALCCKLISCRFLRKRVGEGRKYLGTVQGWIKQSSQGKKIS